MQIVCRSNETPPCPNRVVSLGYCSKHYTRYRKYGDTNVVKVQGIPATDPILRFESKYLVDEVTGCWMWTGAANGNGWPTISLKGKAVMAHRFSYETYVGPIPSGHSVTRSCNHEACVNPEHLTLISNDPIERFWRGVKKESGPDGCWVWQHQGFVFRVVGKPHSPRRFAWTLEKGEAGEFLYSMCGNSRCVRPSHAGGIKAKFWTRVRKADDGCWYWSGAKTGGYAHLTFENKTRYAHHLTFEWNGGKLREGYVLAHKCEHLDCVNPDHLEQISIQMMVDRRDAKMAKAKDKGTKTQKKEAKSSLKEKRAAKQAKRTSASGLGTGT